MTKNESLLQKELRVGIIGAGGIVRQRHLPGLLKIPGVRIVALANSTPESAGAVAREFSLDVEVCPSWEALAHLDSVDIVWIGATPYLHEACAITSLELGKHVFCQARMARNLEEAIRMRETAVRHPELVSMLCPPPFGLAEDAWVRQCLAEERIGRPLTLRLRSLNGAFRDPHAPAHWRQREEISGQNILTLGIFTEVLQRWFGPVKRVFATGRVVIPERRGYFVRIPDVLHVQAEFGGGLLGTWEFSGVHKGPAVNDLEICGENGVLHFDFDTGLLREFSDGAWNELPAPPELLRPWRVEEDFIHAVRNPDAPRPRPDFSEGVAYMRVVDAVWKSLEQRCAVMVNPGVM